MKKIFAAELQKLDAAGLLVSEMPVVHTDNMEVQFNAGSTPINFISNDLLGWRFNDEVRECAIEAQSLHGTGSTCSRSSIGTHELATQLEEKLAQFLSMPDCMVFPSSYVANMGLFEALTNQKDKIFVDELCSPAILDGTQLSSASLVPYLHNDDENLEYHLKCSQSARFRLVVTDGVFDTDTQCAKLDRIHELKGIYDAVTLVDDSLGIGVLGQNGRGTGSHLKMSDPADLVSASFCYALGNVGGGFVAGDKELVSWLRNTSRPYLLSEPLPPAHAATVIKVIEILERDPSAIHQLNAVSEHAKEGLRQRNVQLVDTAHPFISIVVGSTLNTQRMVDHLLRRGFLVSGLCYPNTAEDEALVRICPTAQHTDDQIDSLLIAIDEGISSLRL